MGTDHHFHKKKKRSIESLRRIKSKRDPYDIVLIVCEGEKTEKNYLKGLCQELRLNTANIRVVGTGVDPSRIVEHAEIEYNKTKDYDRVYCVFDKDEHLHYQAALQRINTLRQRKKSPIHISGITSVPCFEFWLLLHFVESSKPYGKTGEKSAADQIISQLKQHISDYRKGHDSIFNITKINLNKAIVRAKRIQKQQEENKADNPSTNFHELVEYLQHIKS